MTTRCDLSELLVTDCAHCRKTQDPFAEPTRTHRGGGTMGPPITASYPGKCACGEWFNAGEPIRADGDGGWLARCCGDVDLEVA